ncbi:hypothetical protein DLAC_03599 [Tieghemostelium lacteum]|uniref:FNIP repeat-containing protein n=1 Tax=Tieghemostelium lacteum TaxID=361077 RepID=A0A152A078_TIELA|nr:hypothetical protein DLAC_03599 [Tieghemostelium lacteum]|eukprot:KYQ99661.1 hypothetical protein DLAC_03599 [Tieghemostelium lacteum]
MFSSKKKLVYNQILNRNYKLLKVTNEQEANQFFSYLETETRNDLVSTSIEINVEFVKITEEAFVKGYEFLGNLKFRNLVTLHLGSSKLLNDDDDDNALLDLNFEIPNSVTTLVLGSDCKFLLRKNNLPQSLTDLTLYYSFVYEGFRWQDIIPSENLKKLTLLKATTNYVADYGFGLKEGLKYLKIDFLSPELLDISPIPLSVETVVFGNTSPIVDYNVVPVNCKTLSIGKWRGALPDSITELTIYHSFILKGNHQSLPRYLKTLNINVFNDKFQRGQLPETLTELNICNLDQPIDPGALPQNLKILRFLNSMSSHQQQLLPGMLPNLNFPKFPSDFSQPISIGHLPINLKILVLGINSQDKIQHGSLPLTLEQLTISDCISLVPGLISHLSNLWLLKTTFLPRIFKPGSLPSSLKRFHIKNINNNTIQPGCLNEGLEELIIDFGIFKMDLKSILPESSLKALKLGYYIIGDIKKGDLPLSLKTFDSDNFPIQEGALHEGLESLKIGMRFRKTITKNMIPSTVSRIYIPHGNYQILDKLDSNRDIINTISTCKSLYEYKEKIRFLEYPIIVTNNSGVNGTDDIQRPKSVFDSFLSFFNEKKVKTVKPNVQAVPNKFKYLHINMNKLCKLQEKSPTLDIEELYLYIEENDWFLSDYSGEIDMFKQCNISYNLTKLVIGSYTLDLPQIVYKYDDSLRFPPNLKCLELGLNFKLKFYKGLLPDSIESLTIHAPLNYDGFEISYLFTPNLKTLCLHSDYTLLLSKDTFRDTNRKLRNSLCT